MSPTRASPTDVDAMMLPQSSSAVIIMANKRISMRSPRRWSQVQNVNTLRHLKALKSAMKCLLNKSQNILVYCRKIFSSGFASKNVYLDYSTYSWQLCIEIIWHWSNWRSFWSFYNRIFSPNLDFPKSKIKDDFKNEIKNHIFDFIRIRPFLFFAKTENPENRFCCDSERITPFGPK